MGYDAAASTAGCVLFRDGNDIEPPEESYEDTEGTFDNPYIPDAEVERAGLPAANFRAMREDEWLPDPNETGEDLNEVEEVKKPTLCEIAKAKFVAAQPKILNAIDSGGVMLVFMAMTFWALLAEDIKTALVSSNELDINFAWVSFVVMMIYAAELIVRSMCQPNYLHGGWAYRYIPLPGFFFILDAIATVTMIFDWMPLVTDEAKQFYDAASISLDAAQGEVEIDTSSLATGSRVGRILRLIRVVRVVKIISMLGKRNKDKEQSEELKPSAVGKRLNELIIQKVIITVGVITMLAPLLSLEDRDGQGELLGLEMLLMAHTVGNKPADFNLPTSATLSCNLPGAGLPASCEPCEGGVAECGACAAACSFASEGGNQAWDPLAQSGVPVAPAPSYATMLSDYGDRVFNTSYSRLVFLDLAGYTYVRPPDAGFHGVLGGTTQLELACPGDRIACNNGDYDAFSPWARCGFGTNWRTGDGTPFGGTRARAPGCPPSVTGVRFANFEIFKFEFPLPWICNDGFPGRSEKDCNNPDWDAPRGGISHANPYYNGITYQGRAWFDASLIIEETSDMSIGMTCFISALLLVMVSLFGRDTTSMVVRPIESMIDIVRKLATNPTLKIEGQSKSKYETESVRVALAKIVGLMQLGFGGAGHEIISANLTDSSGQNLDLMRRGQKKECAYGYCDIRQFTDTVECLQDQVMMFTNSVSEIVHRAAHENRGEPNKNIGDAFLIVWRPVTKKLLDGTKTSTSHTKLVDGALTSFRRTVREIASSQTLKLVTDLPAVHAKFGQDKYRTRIGFGLHFGWSVEGPVGSNDKVDCTYLSPEVKVADRLEAATKIYSSNILMSGQFYDLLSDHLKVGIRLIDHITLKGGHKPLRVYADDRSNLWLKVNPRLVEIYGAEAAYEQFSKTFHEGIDAFIKGDWATAWQKLEGAADFCPKDTPTKLLLKEMKMRSIDPVTPTAPVDWKGYHSSEV